MIKIRYDLTSGQLKRVGKRARGIVGNYRRKYADATTSTGGGGGGGGINRYSPYFERAEDPTLAADFLPADPQTQNKLFRQIITLDPIAGPATEYWKDLAFGERVILSGLDDDKVEQFYYDALAASNIEPMMSSLLGNFLTYGKFVFHMTMDESKGYWDETIVDDLDFVSIKVSPIPSQDPIVDLQPTQENIEWATSPDPRVKEQRRDIDPVLVKLMAAGQPIPLSPENTMFLPRKAYAEDNYGTSYLTRILPYWIYEKALIDASIAGARRKAGPLYLVTAWEDAAPSELNQLDEMFAAAEEDPIGGRVVTRDGVTVQLIGGGGGDIWKLSDDWDFLSTAKTRALGVSENFLAGEATYNSMETVLSVFLQKLKAIRRLFTKRILQEKFCGQLAKNNDFYKTPQKQIRHGYRIGRKNLSSRSDSDLLIPHMEWDEPLEPTSDREYFDMLQAFEDKTGVVVPIKKWAQTVGYDLDKHMLSAEDDLETRKELLAQRRAVIEQREEFGFDAEGAFSESEELPFGGGGGSGDSLFGGEGGGGADEELGGGGLGDLGAGELGGGGPIGGGGDLGGGASEETFSTPALDSLEGFGADTEHSRFPIKKRKTPIQVHAEVITPPGKDKNIEDTLKRLPLWDDGDTLFGLRRRHAAKILDVLDHTDPKRRKKVVSTLPVFLRRKEGLTHLQSEALLYLGMRLGYVPPVTLDSETYEALSRYVTSKMNGSGLTKPITTELTSLSAIMQVAGKISSPFSMEKNGSAGETRRMLPPVLQHEKKLHHSKILTGVTK